MEEDYVQIDYKNEKVDLPKILRYKSIKPKGLPTRQRRVEVNQMSNQNSFSFNDIIRFQFQTDSFIDPYESYIELQVNIPQTEENMPKVTQKEIIVGFTSSTSTAVYGTEKNILPDFSSVPLYLLDGPATSFISEMILYSNGREVERIQEYDQLGMLIHDLGIHKEQKYKGGYYGLASQFGKSDYSYLSQQINNQGRSAEVPQQAVFGTSDGSSLSNIGSSNYELGTHFIQNGYSVSRSQSSTTNDMFSFHSRQQGAFSINNNLYVYQPYFYKSPVTDYLDINIVSQTQAPFVASILASGSVSNTVINQTTNYNTQISQYNKYPGIFNTTFQNQYIDYLNGQFNLLQGGYLKSQSCTPDQFINYAREFALQDGQYGIEHFDCISTTPFYQALNSTNYTIPNTEAVLNADRLKDPAYQPPILKQANVSTDKIDFSQNLSLKRRKKILYNSSSNMNNFTYFCPGIAQARWKDGKPVTSYNIGGASIEVDGSNKAINQKEQDLAMTKKTFYIPLLSGILGHLLPQDQWKLIPGKGCGLLNFEFRLNRFAMFMSGHKHNSTDTTQTPEDVPYDKQFHNGKQGWTVTKMSLHFQLWDFPSQVDDYISQQLDSGIIMNSQAFVNGPTYSIQNTSSLKGNWQINTAVQSLKKLYFWFILDDYAKYNFCRKNFRISHNLKSLQLKAGAEFLPELPITGHAGNLFEFNNETTKDVTPFYTELLRSHGELFSPQGKINITPQNFIVNERAFQPNVHYQSQFQTAFLHETRLVGKAVYSVDLEADPFDFNTLTGKNVASIRPFEIVLDTHSTNGQTRPSTMFTLLHSDMLVSFTKEGIQIAI